jgi:hypothetical protein
MNAAYERNKPHFAVFNPHNRPLEELPIIYGFNNGGLQDNWMGALISEDGHGLGTHLCSNEQWMYHDLGILQGCRADRHKIFQEHYPNGYRMDFVPFDEVDGHKGLNDAYAKNQQHLRDQTGETSQ